MVVKSSGFDLRAASAVAVFDVGAAVVGFGDGSLAIESGGASGSDCVAAANKARPPGNSQGASVSGVGVLDTEARCYACGMDGSVMMMELDNSTGNTRLLHQGSWAKVGCAAGVWGIGVGTGVLGLAGEDGEVTVIERETMDVVRRLSGHKGACRGVDLGDNATLVSCGRDATVRVWDLRQGGTEVGVLYGHKGWVHAVAALGHKIISGSGDKSVRVWDLRAMAEERVLTGHQFRVWDVAIAEGSAYSCSSDETVRCWDTASGECTRVMDPGSREGVVSVGISGSGEYLCGGSEDGHVRLWRLSDAPLQQSVLASEEEPVPLAEQTCLTNPPTTGLTLLQRLEALDKRLDVLLNGYATTYCLFFSAAWEVGDLGVQD